MIEVLLWVITYLLAGRIYWVFFRDYLMPKHHKKIMETDEFYCTLFWPLGLAAYISGFVKGVVDCERDHRSDAD